MFNISKFAINNRVFAYFIVLAIFLIGGLSYFSHPALEDPQYTIRSVKITTINPGMSPAEVERLITTPIEEEGKNIPELKETYSTSSIGVSSVTFVIKDKYYDLENIWKKIRIKMNNVRSKLPQNTSGPYVNDEFGDIAIATVAVTFDGYNVREQRDITKKITTHLYKLSGVAKIRTFGLNQERVYLEISNSRMAQFGITPLQIIQAMQKQNVISSGNIVEVSKLNIMVAATGSFQKLKDIADVVIKVPHSTTILHLSDIVKIRIAEQDPIKNQAYFNGEKAIALGIYPQANTHFVELGKQLKHDLAELQKTLPVGVQLHLATFQPEKVLKSTNEFKYNLYEAFIIVTLSIFCFLGIRDGIVIGLFIPLTMLLTLYILSYMGVELQRVSIAALIISLGLLVDNGVVVAEDINRQVARGVDKATAIARSYKVLAAPLLTATLTTILVFVPILLSNDSAAEYTRSLAQVIVVALLASWLLAFFVVPALAFPFYKKTQVAATDKAVVENKWVGAYGKLLGVVLKNKVIFLLLILAMFVASVYCFRFVPKRFFPAAARNQFIVNIDFPNQTSIRTTSTVTSKISNYLNKHKAALHITSSIAYAGFSGPRFYLTLEPFANRLDRSFVIINTNSADNTDAAIYAVESALLSQFPQIRARVAKLWLGNTEEGLVKVRIFGDSYAKLQQYAGVVKKAMRNAAGTQYVMDNWQLPSLRVLVKVNQAKAKRIGITSENVAQSLTGYYSGIKISNFRRGNQLIPIVLRSEKSDRFNFSRLHTLIVYNPRTNVSVPLDQIATLIPVFEYTKIQHHDMHTAITVSAKNTEHGAAYLLASILPTLEKLKLPHGYHYEIAGETQASADAQGSLFEYFPLCLFIIVAILIWQFKSVVKVIIIIGTLPLSIIGALVGLLVMHATLSFIGMLGILSLAGIIINHGIVLVDTIGANVVSGMLRHDAVMQAAQSRLRPILATTVTTVLGVLPLLIFGGELWHPLASIITVGLIVCTIINIFFVPSLYLLFYAHKDKQAS